jgi:hypothetical protein
MKLDKVVDLKHLPVMVDMGVRLRQPFREEGLSIPVETAELTTVPNATRISYNRAGERSPELFQESLTQRVLVWGLFIGNPKKLVYTPVNGSTIRNIYLVPVDKIERYAPI